MKIAILTPTFSQFSGIDRIVERQAEDYSKEGHEITIFCFKAEILTKYANVVELGMPKNQTLERIYRLFFFLDILKIHKVLKQLKGFDKTICHFYPMTLIGKAAKEKYGITYEYHNAGVADPELFRSFVERTYIKILRYFTNNTIQSADEIVCISKFLQDVVKKETGKDSQVEYVKIDENRFGLGLDGTKIRAKYNIQLNEKLCLYVGRLSPHKGVNLLIQAIEKLPEHYKLIIVGKKTFDNYLNDKYSNRIIFTGFVPDEELPSYYAACDIYTTATLWEGFDMPMAEANACGKPCVAFDIGAHPEVLKKGKLVTVKDIDAFAKAIMEVNNE